MLELWFLPSKCSLRNIGTKSEFSADALTEDDVINLCSSLGAAEEQLDELVTNYLAALGLLPVPPYELNVDQTRDQKTDDFFWLRAGAKYWDYADAEAFRKDARDMARYEHEGPESPLWAVDLEVASAPSLGPDAKKLFTLAHQVFDSQYSERFHHELVHKKIIPSLGARHGINCYLSYFDERLRRRALLAIGPDGADYFPPAGAVSSSNLAENCLVICAHFDRYQWRYRNGWVYQCILLDVGHALAALRVCAKNLSVALTFEQAPEELLNEMNLLNNEPLIIAQLSRSQPFGV